MEEDSRNASSARAIMAMVSLASTRTAAEHIPPASCLVLARTCRALRHSALASCALQSVDGRICERLSEKCGIPSKEHAQEVLRYLFSAGCSVSGSALLAALLNEDWGGDVDFLMDWPEDLLSAPFDEAEESEGGRKRKREEEEAAELHSDVTNILDFLLGGPSRRTQSGEDAQRTEEGRPSENRTEQSAPAPTEQRDAGPVQDSSATGLLHMKISLTELDFLNAFRKELKMRVRAAGSTLTEVKCHLIAMYEPVLAMCVKLHNGCEALTSRDSSNLGALNRTLVRKVAPGRSLKDMEREPVHSLVDVVPTRRLGVRRFLLEKFDFEFLQNSYDGRTLFVHRLEDVHAKRQNESPERQWSDIAPYSSVVPGLHNPSPEDLCTWLQRVNACKAKRVGKYSKRGFDIPERYRERVPVERMIDFAVAHGIIRGGPGISPHLTRRP